VNRKLKGNNPRLEINLKEIFGKNLPSDGALVEAIGQAILDRIVERTESGKGVNGKGFKGYSTSYKESLDFKAFGKSGKVNLKLSGDMLGLMDITDQSRNKLTIGWDDSDEAAKAHGHITGGGAGGNLPVRDFFGLTQKDLREIKNKFKDDIDG